MRKYILLYFFVSMSFLNLQAQYSKADTVYLEFKASENENVNLDILKGLFEFTKTNSSDLVVSVNGSLKGQEISQAIEAIQISENEISNQTVMLRMDMDYADYNLMSLDSIVRRRLTEENGHLNNSSRLNGLYVSIKDKYEFQGLVVHFNSLDFKSIYIPKTQLDRLDAASMHTQHHLNHDFEYDIRVALLDRWQSPMGFYWNSNVDGKDQFIQLYDYYDQGFMVIDSTSSMDQASKLLKGFYSEQAFGENKVLTDPSTSYASAHENHSLNYAIEIEYDFENERNDYLVDAIGLAMKAYKDKLISNGTEMWDYLKDLSLELEYSGSYLSAQAQVSDMGIAEMLFSEIESLPTLLEISHLYVSIEKDIYEAQSSDSTLLLLQNREDGISIALREGDFVGTSIEIQNPSDINQKATFLESLKNGFFFPTRVSFHNTYSGKMISFYYSYIEENIDSSWDSKLTKPFFMEKISNVDPMAMGAYGPFLNKSFPGWSMSLQDFDSVRSEGTRRYQVDQLLFNDKPKANKKLSELGSQVYERWAKGDIELRYLENDSLVSVTDFESSQDIFYRFHGDQTPDDMVDYFWYYYFLPAAMDDLLNSKSSDSIDYFSIVGIRSAFYVSAQDVLAGDEDIYLLVGKSYFYEDEGFKSYVMPKFYFKPTERQLKKVKRLEKYPDNFIALPNSKFYGPNNEPYIYDIYFQNDSFGYPDDFGTDGIFNDGVIIGDQIKIKEFLYPSNKQKRLFR